jgi:hypothetical protein
LIVLENRAHLPKDKFDPLAQVVAEHRSIKHALDWLQSLEPPLTFSDIVTQDEFSHDILIEYLQGLYLVYDVT